MKNSFSLREKKLQKSFFLKSLSHNPATRDLMWGMAILAYFPVVWFSLQGILLIVTPAELGRGKYRYRKRVWNCPDKIIGSDRDAPPLSVTDDSTVWLLWAVSSGTGMSCLCHSGAILKFKLCSNSGRIVSAFFICILAIFEAHTGLWHSYPYAIVSIYVAFMACSWTGSPKCFRSRLSCFSSSYIPESCHWQLAPCKLLRNSVLLKMCAVKIFKNCAAVGHSFVYENEAKERTPPLGHKLSIRNLWRDRKSTLFCTVSSNLDVFQILHVLCSLWLKATWVSSISTDVLWAKSTL